jgi:hypothetical protein
MKKGNAGEGKFWSYEEIEKNRQQYIENKPLTRKEVEEMMKE